MKRTLKSLFWLSMAALTLAGFPTQAGKVQNPGKVSPGLMSYRPVAPALSQAIHAYYQGLNVDAKAKLNPVIQAILGDASFNPENELARLLLAPITQNIQANALAKDPEKALKLLNRKAKAAQTEILAEAEKTLAEVKKLKEQSEIKPSRIKRISELLNMAKRLQSFSAYLTSGDMLGSIKDAGKFLHDTIFDLSSKKMGQVAAEAAGLAERGPEALVDASPIEQISYYMAHLEGPETSKVLAVQRLESLAIMESSPQEQEKIASSLVLELNSNPKGPVAKQVGETLANIGGETPHARVKQIIVKGLIHSRNPEDLARVIPIVKKTDSKGFVNWALQELARLRDSVADAEKPAIQEVIDLLSSPETAQKEPAVPPASVEPETAKADDSDQAVADPKDDKTDQTPSAAKDQKGPEAGSRLAALRRLPKGWIFMALILGLIFLGPRFFGSTPRAVPVGNPPVTVPAAPSQQEIEQQKQKELEKKRQEELERQRREEIRRHIDERSRNPFKE